MDYISTFQRVEHKYLLSRQQADMFYQSIQSHVQKDRYPQYSLFNVYYDSCDYQMISKSIESPKYKEKLRVRTYGENCPFLYVEMKKKYEGIVYKRRIERKIEDSSLLDYSQIGKELSYMFQHYDARPKVFIAYERKAFQAVDEADVRITFDTDIRYRLDHLELSDAYEDVHLLDKDSVLVEIKVMDRYPLWLIHALSVLQVQRTSFSKYGTIYTNIIKEKKNV